MNMPAASGVTNDAPREDHSDRAPRDDHSERSFTPQEREQEKVRLQSLVNSFARKAVRGCPCRYFKEGTGGRAPTQYRIDKTLEYLIVMSPDDGTKAEVT